MKHLLLAQLMLVTSLSAAETIRQATEARLWLRVPALQPALQDVQLSSGKVSTADWEKEAAVRERLTDITFPIHWWSWSETTVRFTPVYDGMLELVLNGPWAADTQGAVFRQEVLWDDISAEGANIKNGGFETAINGQPEAWVSPWASYPGANVWPLKEASTLNGKGVGASWNNRPLCQTVEVKSGCPVTLVLHAKAATPPDFSAPRRLGADTPAHHAAALLKRGMNLGCGWEAPRDASWRVCYTPKDIDHMADEGFDHVRVPVAFHNYLNQGPEGLELSPGLLAELEPVLHRALDRKLCVLLDWHNFNEFTTAPAEQLVLFTGGWESIARHFRSWPPGLFLELLNEPYNALTTEALAPIYRKTISVIHAIDPTRIVVVSPGSWGNIKELDDLRLPESDNRIIVTVHCYEPFPFTHQGAAWVGYQDLKGIHYPGPPESPYQLPPSLADNAGLRSFITGYNTQPIENNPSSPRPIRELLDTAAAWALYFGRPVHLGEFGGHEVGDAASRARYLRDVRILSEQRHIPWTMWEWKANFGYWDSKANRPRFRASLFE